MIGDLSQLSSLSDDVSKHVIHNKKSHISHIGYWFSLLYNVLYVSNLKANLVSVGQVVDQNCVMTFLPNGNVI